MERYHEWMKDPKLLHATGSEPLSMEEEIAMQQSWSEDPNKCTFIILSREDCDLNKDQAEDSDFVVRNLHAMVGDVNLFFSEEEEENDGEQAVSSAECGHDIRSSIMQAELDVMIAEESYRKRGLGREASCLMMLYGVRRLGIRRVFCKINDCNKASLDLFEKLGFLECAYAACFQQFELELKRDTAQDMMETLEALYGGKMSTFSCPIITDGEDDS